MDICEKIDKLRVARGWSFYRLSQESGLSQQTFTQWMSNKSKPTLPALTAICQAFEISLAELFADDDILIATPEVKQLINDWQCLSQDEKTSILLVVSNYLKKK